MRNRSNVTHLRPRIVRHAPELLGLYLRAGRNDHKALLNLFAAGQTACFGVIFDATLEARHKELKEQVLAHRMDAILDTKVMQLALPGGYNRTLATLPWANPERVHTPIDFQGRAGRQLIATIGNYVLEHGYTEVLAPTHLIRSWDDQWLTIDIESTRQLREYLDQNGASQLPLIYPLAISYETFRIPEKRAHVINALINVKADAIWLKVDGHGGAHATPTAVRNFILAAEDFHQLGRKIVADYVGGKVGLALMAFGAVGGIAHGLGVFERFSSAHLRNAKPSKPFTPPMPVYFPQIDAMLTPKEAEQLLGGGPRATAAFACPDKMCCKRGAKDMLADPRRHYLVQRMHEVSALSKIPEPIRPQRFLDTSLRPATDRALQAASQKLDNEKLSQKLQNNRRRLDSLRVALSDHLEKRPPRSFAVAPERRAAREARDHR